MTLATRLRAALAAPADRALRGDWDFAADGSGTAEPMTPAAVLIAVIDQAAPAMLLTRRNAKLRRHAGQVAFPGGRIDAEDAGPIAAALREAQEEVALPPHHVTVLGATVAGAPRIMMPVGLWSAAGAAAAAVVVERTVRYRRCRMASGPCPQWRRTPRRR